jgi:hypothetical protein
VACGEAVEEADTDADADEEDEADADDDGEEEAEGDADDDGSAKEYTGKAITIKSITRENKIFFLIFTTSIICYHYSIINLYAFQADAF